MDTRTSQEEVTTSPVFVQCYTDRKVRVGQQSGGIKLRGYENLKIQLWPVLKLSNTATVTIRKDLRKRTGDLMERTCAGGLHGQPRVLTLMEN